MCEVLEELSKEEIIKRFASIDLHRMLLYYRDAPDLNAAPAQRHQAPRKDAEGLSAREKRDAHVPRQMTEGMVELVMNVGKLNGLSPKKLMSLVNVADREKSIDIGRINIVKMQSYFEVPRSESPGVIDSFIKSHIDFEGRQVSVALAGNTRERPESAPRGPRGPKRGGPSARARTFDNDAPRKNKNRNSGKKFHN